MLSGHHEAGRTTSVLMQADTRKTQESERLRVHWALVKDPSERCPRCPLVNIEQEETLYPSFIQLHLDSPPPYIATKKPCVRVVLGKAPSTINISREGGEIGQEHIWPLHSREAVEDWEA